SHEDLARRYGTLDSSVGYGIVLVSQADAGEVELWYRNAVPDFMRIAMDDFWYFIDVPKETTAQEALRQRNCRNSIVVGALHEKMRNELAPYKSTIEISYFANGAAN